MSPRRTWHYFLPTAAALAALVAAWGAQYLDGGKAHVAESIPAYAQNGSSSPN
jgi:hypothetical protein